MYRRGQRQFLFTDRADAAVSAIIEHAQSLGAPEIAVPRKIMNIAEIPVLGTGKTDYVTIQRLAAVDGQRAS